MREPIILSHQCSPGDIICMTALVRDLARAYPDKFNIEVFTSCPSLWENNPYVAKNLSSPRPGVPFFKIDYGPYIHQANDVPLHFLTAFHREFTRLTGVDVPVTEPKPDLHLSAQEEERLIKGRYWLMFAGGKSDFTTKIWSARYCQQVVDGLAKFGIHVVQTGANYNGHWHPPLRGVLNILGKAGLRDTLRLIKQAEGVLCPITFGMHAAAAFDKPCVIWAGGREHWWWEAYVNHDTLQTFGPVASGKVRVPHRYLHTQGLLDCCKLYGCWMNKVTPLEADRYRLYCAHPENDGYGQIIPRCQKMITPHHVIDAVLSYYKDGTLEPIGPKPTILLPNGVELLDEGLPASDPPIEMKADRFDNDQPSFPEIVRAFVGQTSFLKGVNKAGTTIAIEDPMDSPIIGGKFDICVHLQDDVPAQHLKCLQSILSTVPHARRDIHVICNGVGSKTMEYVNKLLEDRYVKRIAWHPEAIGRYRAMRLLLQGAAFKPRAPYLIWFEDNAIADKDPQWWTKLAQTIINFHQEGARLFGAQHICPTDIARIRERPWYKARNGRLRNGAEAANGSYSVYVHPAFWAMATEMITIADIPDSTLKCAEDAWVIGEQVWQAGYTIKHWNGQRQFISYAPVQHTATGRVEPATVT